MGALRPKQKKEEFGMKQAIIKKLIIALILFVILFSNFGYTLIVIASSDEFEVIKHGFFEKEEIQFEAYFGDEEEKSYDKIVEVNKTVELNLKLTPKIEGYLKNAVIKAVSENGELPNFRIKNIKSNSEELEIKTDNDNIGSEKTEEILENVVVENEIAEEENVSASEETENIVDNQFVIEENNNIKDKIGTTNDVNTTNEIVENEEQEILENEEEQIQENTEKKQEESKDEQEKDNNEKQEEILIDEEQVIEEKTNESEEEIDLISDVKLISDNEISISNVIEENVYVLELEYVQEENFKVEDLYKNIKLQLSGTYINSDLAEVKIAKEKNIKIGWEFTKDVNLENEYTKFSPFKVGETVGTIVESTIIVEREILEGKYLPLKTTRIVTKAPRLNGKTPIEVSVIAEKLLATRGEDIGEVNFYKENWNYNEQSGEITILVNNGQEGIIKNASGIDEYTLIYRYEDYIEDDLSKLTRDVALEAEQYNGKENKIIKKEIRDEQKVEVNVGELVTYSINSTEEKIEKSKIYANYNSEEALHETEYTSYITLNILTSDMLDNVKIDCSKEVYKDVNGFEFEAQEIYYKNIKFNYSEIKNILENSGKIEIYNLNGALLYTLDSSTIQNNENCIVNTNYASGIIIYVKHVDTNGTINFELTKVIKKCNYEKSAFKNFVELESRIKAEVKYLDLEETLSLEEVKTTKKFNESYTRANIYINKEDLTTIEQNENIEIRVELNNDKQDSDLYINPSFEFIFPKHVKQVTVENINLLYENGLRISDFHTYTEADVVKMRIELSGVQKTFSENTITNGTNIIINVKIKVDEYTPVKQDQIKMYYCNEGVSNYESQTKWTVSKQIPNGILKTTNGFDVALIKYNAPRGLIAINSIVNYDGNLSEIKSVKEGEKSAQIAINSSSKIATMELLALNNTGNECSDIVMIGRIPFKGNKDVISNKDLGITTTAVMQEFIKENIQNFNMTTIYYSTNENATKDLENEENGWILAEQIANVTEVKSFMIMVKGNMAPGAVLRYTYQFEIPEKLPYEANISGSFGIYYNNNTDVAIIYESVLADKVSLKTEAGPKVEALLSVDVGDGTEVGEARFLNYTLKVKNVGSVVAENITIKNPVPQYTVLYEYMEEAFVGNDNYVSSSKTILDWTIEKLDIGEEKTYKYMVKTREIPPFESYCYINGFIQDESGYYYEETDENGNINKKYVDESFKVFIENKATISIGNLAINIDSNIVKNQIVDSIFDLNFSRSCSENVPIGNDVSFSISAKNISGKVLNNIKLEVALPSNLKYKNTLVKSAVEDIKATVNYNEEEQVLQITFEEIIREDLITIYIDSEVISGDLIEKDIQAHFYTGDGKKESSTPIYLTFLGPKLEIEQTTNLIENHVKEQEYIEFLITVKNTGNWIAKDLKISNVISENLKNVTAEVTGDISTQLKVENNKINTILYGLESNKKMVLKISGNATEIEDLNKRNDIINKAIISANYAPEQETEEIRLNIYYNPEKVKSEEEILMDNLIEYEEININSNQEIEENKEINHDSNVVLEEDEEKENDNLAENNSIENNYIEDQESEENKTEEKVEEIKTNNQISNESLNEDIVKPNIEEQKYTISGSIWLDTNKNGIKDDNEENISATKVQLLKSDTMIKATTTDGNGKYEFSGLSKGTYKVIFIYDGIRYMATTYKVADTQEEINSVAIESNQGTSVTNNIEINDSNIININFGLVRKKVFNMSINKYITKAILKTKEKEEVHNYENLKLGKLEINPKEINEAEVTLEYSIIVKNDGEVVGNVAKIMDIIPKDMIFDIYQNENWYLGDDGNVYNDSLKDITLNPGESKELKLILTKKMTENNTGVISNKVAILGTENAEGRIELSDDNVDTQEMLILVSTGKTLISLIITILSFIVIALVIWSIKSKTVLEKLKIMRNGKIYK